ncbi:VOC family protein [Amycolatopsis sp. NPDC059657]|uniref:VOC family protein n=1 Tax=Amycolatopsis sp. NPDC059657 TaxID=3346899 RepID=UPI00366A8429
MASRLNPYIGFGGNAREAMEFYKEVFGGTLVLNTFGDFGDKEAPNANNIMHGQLETDGGYTIMGADTASAGEYKPSDTMSVSLSGDDADELRGYWEKLSSGGTITVPMEKQMWGDEFGMCADRFGITWMVNIVAAQQA